MVSYGGSPHNISLLVPQTYKTKNLAVVEYRVIWFVKNSIMIKILLIVLWIAFAQLVQAQRTISGKIIDVNTKQASGFCQCFSCEYIQGNECK